MPLIVIQSQPSAAELFSKDSIFFAQVIDSILLLLVYPAGHSDEDQPEGVKDFRCFSPSPTPFGRRNFRKNNRSSSVFSMI
jgi:hypothetical protein